MSFDEILQAARERGGAVVTFIQAYHGPAYRAACRATFDPDERARWVHAALLIVLKGATEGEFSGLEGDELFNSIRLRVVCDLLERYRERTSGERYGDTALDPLTLARYMGISSAEPLSDDDNQAVMQRLKKDQLLSSDLRTLLSLDRAFRTGHLTPYESEAEEESRIYFTSLLTEEELPETPAAERPDRPSGRRASSGSAPSGILESIRRWLLPPAD